LRGPTSKEREGKEREGGERKGRRERREGYNQPAFLPASSVKKQGLGMSSLNVVFTALVVSRIEYALPSFSGFLSPANIDRLNAALRKARRWGITDIEISMEDLIERSDSRLFSKVQSDSHCLNQLLPPPSPASQIYDLRPRGHTHSLPSVKTTNFMKSFIIKSLFSYK